jgi:hypothetical protein
MNYTKPEVALLGDATQVIQVKKAAPPLNDGGLNHVIAAYDLDE